ncbi:MAG: NAD-dependent epimerase/dehydratase family protein, partial [Proteobacteria bacterium]|nr:NAD-dependent epimerase/dehydratase family protein [Pseudomonadota bacterium]
MKFFFTGGTGFIGSILCKALIKEGHEVTMLISPMKSGDPFHKRVTFIEGDPTRPGDWQERVAEHDVVVNLAGASLFQRWNSKVKKEIFDSRVLATTNIVEALKNNNGKAAHLFSASGVGYYGYHGDEILDEDSPPGNSFLARIALEWEAVARKAEKFNIRVILCRFGIVLGGEGGALRKILQLSNLHIGGRWGGG